MKDDEVDTTTIDDSLEKFVAKGCVKERVLFCFVFYCCCHCPLFLIEDTRVLFEY